MRAIIGLYLFSISVVNAMTSNKTLEGYPSGFLSNCPGVEKPITVSRRSLKHLTLTVVGEEGVVMSRRVSYNYYQMDKLAEDHDVDFTRKKTIVYVIGYLDNPFIPFSWPLLKMYKDLNYNVFSVDTSYFSTQEYPDSARFIRTLGKHAAEMLANLRQYGLDPKDLEAVGLSLGAQTMSFIAKHYQAITGVKISKLIGLDPAGPCFRNAGPESRLDQNDADFVLMIATNIDGYGMAAPVGHVNFYVNGGEYQPGDHIWFICDVVCSHIRAYFLWISALKSPNSFIGIQCDTVQQARERKCYDNVPYVTNVLGPNVNRSREGIFYLSTTNTYPYYLGTKGLSPDFDFSNTAFTKYYNKDSI